MSSGIKIYDVSFYQTVMFEYINNQRVILPFEKQKHIDFKRMRDKCSAVIMKCGQRNYKDPAFDISWRNAKEAGLRRGSYWFCDKNDTGKNQAKLYWQYLKPDIGEGVHAADFEAGGWTNLHELYAFVNEFQQLSGLPDHKIAIYTGYYYFTAVTQISNLSWFSKYPLWIAAYTRNPIDVRIPKPWNKFTIWQYGTPAEGLDVGVHSIEIDGNWFNGTQTEFERMFGKPIIKDEVPTKPHSPYPQLSAVFKDKIVVYKRGDEK